MKPSALDKLLKGNLPVDFNWNCDIHPDVPLPKTIPTDPTANQITQTTIVSEDLRDGLHGIKKIPHQEKIRKYIDMLALLGISNMTVGIYPGERNKTDASIKHTLRYLAKHHPTITPNVLTLTSDDAIQWAHECKQINHKLNALIFMGSSPSRLLVEEWEMEYILERLAWAVHTAAHTYGIRVIGATEHTTQTPPDFLREIVKTTISNGARYFCVADTVGIARPIGVYRIINFIRNVLHSMNADDVEIDWHGHDDLGNAQANTLLAIASGATRIHTVARGIGERAGNTRMESVIMNMVEILEESKQKIPWQLQFLGPILDTYNDLTDNPPPTHGPFGIRAFSTSLGIHTSAMLKAKSLADQAKNLHNDSLSEKLKKMAGRIYCGIDATLVGRETEIHVGPWSGTSTVQLAAKTELHLNVDTLSEAAIQQTLSTAKKFSRELTKEELTNLLTHTDHTDMDMDNRQSE